jgi:hypothetical protein
VRLLWFLLLFAPLLPCTEKTPPDFKRNAPREKSNVCSIPLLEPPGFHEHLKSFDRMAIPSPRSLDHNQISPPAPPCTINRESWRPKMLPKPPLRRTPK